MPPLTHSEIGASGTGRWMNCAGSVRLNRLVKKSETSVYAAEGTAAHQFCEDCYNLGRDPHEQIGTDCEGFPVTKEMADAAMEYLVYIRDRSEEIAATPVLEHSFALDWISPDMFGTSDAVIAQTFGTVEIIDFKYGAGVAVNAEMNSQLLYYALGVVGEHNPEAYTDVRITVVQPRASHPSGETIRSFDLTVEDLYRWAEEELIPAVKATQDPEAPLTAGTQCRFCDAQNQCPKLRGIATSTALVTAEDAFADEPVKLPDPSTLTDDQTVKVYEFAGILSSWIKSVQSATKDRLMNGEKIEGLKVVTGRKTRKWADDEAAEKKLKRLLTAAEAVNKTVISPAQAEKKLGKDKTKIEKLIAVTQGHQVVPDSDKRDAILIEDAAAAFEV